MNIEALLANDMFASAVSILLSLLMCFFGYKLEKLFIALAAALLGAWAGYEISQLISSRFAFPAWGTLVLMAVLALICVGLSFKLYLTGVFVLCFALVAIAANAYISNQKIMLIVAIAGGIVAGILGVRLTRPALIVTSAISGGVTALSSAADMTNIPQLTTLAGGYIPLIIGLVLALCGMAYQFKHS